MNSQIKPWLRNRYCENPIGILSFRQLVATGRLGSDIHSLHEPGYSFEFLSSATSMARRLWQAGTPEPHWCITSLLGVSPMIRSKDAFSSLASRNLPFWFRLFLKNRFTAPGMCPAMGSIVSLRPWNRSAALASMISNWWPCNFFEINCASTEIFLGFGSKVPFEHPCVGLVSSAPPILTQSCTPPFRTATESWPSHLSNHHNRDP